MHEMKKIFFSTFVLLFIPANTFAQSLEVRGQLSSWLLFTSSSIDETRLGLRYIPELSVIQPLTDDKNLDAEISLNANTEAPFKSLSDLSDNAELKLYRMWGRYTSSQFEARLGRQKINFGPAKILRSLMWFDRVDPRDPFELTDGVDGLLMRYYFLNNANVWLWGLYGNDDIKGLELVKSNQDEVELGGRFQLPVPKGEMAMTYHHRKIDTADWEAKMTTILKDDDENRLAVDGNWDIGVGLWFEAVVSHINTVSKSEQWREFLTLGCDYTFASGIHVLGEHFVASTSTSVNETRDDSEISALSVDYNLGLLDRINAIGFYDWTRDDIYYFAGWQRTYDNWQINVLAFSNRDDIDNTFAGDGVQMIITYNH